MEMPKCDKCGRFFSPSKGGSWMFVPDSDVGMGEERERCAKCTEQHGALSTHGRYVDAICCGMYPPSNASFSRGPSGPSAGSDS